MPSSYLEPGLPRLIPGHPDKISVLFLGARRTIDRDWYDVVRKVASAPNHATARALMAEYSEHATGNK